MEPMADPAVFFHIHRTALQFLQVMVLSILWPLQMPLLARFAVWVFPPAVRLSGYPSNVPSSARASQQEMVT